MNQDAGLKLLAGTHKGVGGPANLENVATGDIIIVEEIALKNSDSIFFIKENGRFCRHVLKVQIRSNFQLFSCRRIAGLNQEKRRQEYIPW